jgi:hypothetical protein
MPRIAWLLLALVLVALVLRRFAARRTERPMATAGPDELVLNQLRKAGSDLSQPHRPEFFLYVPTEAAARAVAQRFEQEGFVSDVHPSPKRSDWSCVLSKTMVLTPSGLTQLRTEFVEVTRAYGGEYDGWGTEVVK